MKTVKQIVEELSIKYELTCHDDIILERVINSCSEDISINKFCACFRKDFMNISTKELAHKNNISVYSLYRFEEGLNKNYQYIFFYLNVLEPWQRHLFIDLLYEIRKEFDYDRSRSLNY